jgi:ornithine carbamoyltransferase
MWKLPLRFQALQRIGPVSVSGVNNSCQQPFSTAFRNAAAAEGKKELSEEEKNRPSHLKGRDLISFDEFTPNDIKTILWTAMDLKSAEKGQIRDLCADRSAFCIFEDTMTKLALTSAGKRLGSSVTFLHTTHFNPKYDLTFYGKSLSSAADIIFVDFPGWKESDLEKLAVGSLVPVVNIRSNLYAPAIALAEVLSIHEYYEFLRRLTLSYIGPEDNSLLTTYANLLPKLGMHFRYICDGQKMNEKVWEKGLVLAKKHNTEVHHCDSLADAIFRANIISTCFHNLSELYLTVKDVKEADLNWTLLHHEVYKSASVDPELLHSKQSLVWDSMRNFTWIIKAIMVCTMTNYEVKLPRPKFEGVE